MICRTAAGGIGIAQLARDHLGIRGAFGMRCTLLHGWWDVARSAMWVSDTDSG